MRMVEESVRRTKRKRKHITLTRLVEVSRKIGEESLISRTERSASWDFERSSEYVRKQGLRDHITFVSAKHRDKTLPLNSERHIYELENIVVRDLEIELDDRSVVHAVEDWGPVSYAKWHFEGCRFECPSSNMWAIAFPWRGSFRFQNGEFCFRSSRQGGVWAFAFKSGSRVWFVGNDFADSDIQTRCVGTEAGEANSEETSTAEAWGRLGHIAFVANKRVGGLWIQDGYSSIEIYGMNRVDRLSVNLIVDADEGKRTSVYIGPRERIDPWFHNSLHHRSLFLAMRRLAAINHDGRQLAVLDRQLERIEYFLNKGQDIPSLLDYRVWIEYWQDRVLYAWRRWSSDFYRSWLRPLAMLVGGYLLINAVPPAFIIESFSVSHWIDLTLRPVAELATYETSLGRIVGREYEAVSASAKAILKLAGLIEMVWIGIWAFAFAKAIRR